MPKKKRVYLTICLNEYQRGIIDLAAKANGRPISQWARLVLVAAANKPVKP